MNDDDDRANRRRVRLALSELFLDTDFSLLEEHVVRELADSPFPIAEIERMLIHDVYPVCAWNLLSVAGVWTGFDAQWLDAETSRRKGLLTRMWTHTVARVTVPRWKDWRRVKAAVRSRRRAAGAYGGSD